VEEAEARYLEIARGLGWEEGAGAVEEIATPLAKGEQDEDDIWDPPDYQHASAGEGTGNVVSTLAAAPDEMLAQNERSLHALALAGDADALRRFLDTDPEADLNEADEFVSARGTRSQTGNEQHGRDTRRCTSRATAGTPPSCRCSSSAARTGQYGCGRIHHAMRGADRVHRTRTR
jgi:hypothetical protein